MSCAEAWRQETDVDGSRHAWANDVTLLRDRMHELLQRPNVIQALSVASSALAAGIAVWNRDPDGKKGLQAERSLVRYFLRMAGRSTPFGLFSGCSVGRIQLEDVPQLLLAPSHEYRSSTRLDFDYLFALTAELRRNRALQLEMRYGLNSTLHRMGQTWHYVESRPTDSSQTHHLVQLATDEYLERVLACAKEGNRSFAELAGAIRGDESSPLLTSEEVDNYLRELIESEVLVSDIQPLLTGKDPLDDLLEQLRKLPSASPFCEILDDVRNVISAFDRRQLDVTSEEYRSLALKLEALPAQVTEGRLVQVDMFKPVLSANLSQSVLNEVYSALEILGRLSSLNEPRDLPLFRKAFQERYDQEWVPLLEALDVDTGVGYGLSAVNDGSPLLDGLHLEADSPPRGLWLNDFQSLLVQKMIDCGRAGGNELCLELADFPSSRNADEVLPSSFCVLASLVAPSPEALQQGDFELLFKGGDGPSCAKPLGRFCPADNELDGFVRSALRGEESDDPESVYAEIVYLPEGRMGNVLFRPVLRDYEIVYRARSGAPTDRQITADDLLLSVRHGEIILYSKRLKRRVIPRLSSAHGYAYHGLSPIYRLLCDLQNQGGKRVPTFTWGAMDKFNALPRVRIGRIVLAVAQWRLSSVESSSLTHRDRHIAFLRMKELQRKRGLPRWVALAEGDNMLPVDLDNPLSVDTLIHLLQRSPEAKLTEIYPQPGSSGCVVGPEGSYEHELLIPLIKRRYIPQVHVASTTLSGTIVKDVALTIVPRAARTISAGSDWQFVKVYGGSSSLDHLMIDELAPLLSRLNSNGAIIRWFFVRYADPAPHLRLRFQTHNNTFCSDLSYLLQSLLAKGVVWNVQYDTYQREIERYGGLAGTLLSEDIFCVDSEIVVAILQNLSGNDCLNERWRIALLGVDTLLLDCGFDVREKSRLIKHLRESLAIEFKLSSSGKRSLSSKFRKERAALKSILVRQSDRWDAAYQFALRALTDRSERTKLPILALRDLDQRSELSNDFFQMAGSYVHMHVNRMIRSFPKLHELVLYDFLSHLYDGDLALERQFAVKG